jgi:small subunit ribosomal protein S15
MITKKSQLLVEKSKKHASDTGSMEVQIASLSAEITRLADHFKTHPKDFSSKRGLLKMVTRRRSYLQYLAKNDKGSYEQLIERLELRK